jgi:hypothetical protein
MAWYDKLFRRSSAETIAESPAKGLSATPLTVEQQVLEKYTGTHNWTPREFKEAFRDFKSSHDVNDHDVSTAFSAIYTKVSQVRQLMWADIERIRCFYLAETAIDQIAEDALTPDITTGEILSVTSKRPEIQTRIDRINERWNIDKLVMSIASDLIAHGDYTISTEVVNVEDDEKEQESLVEGPPRNNDEPDDFVDRDDGKVSKDADKDDAENEVGLIELRDDVTQPLVVPVTNFGEIEGYLQMDEQTGRVEVKEEADFVHFSLDSKRIRIDAHDSFLKGHQQGIQVNKEILKDIPRYIRVGKGVIHAVLSKFKELELLEQLVPASKLQKLSAGTLIGFSVPQGYDLKKAQTAAKQIEGLVNKKLAINTKDKNEVTLENIMNSTGKVKMVPLFGDKGRMEILQTRSDEPDDLLNSIEDLRRTILGSIGTPYEIIFGGDEGRKGELLKRYARYLRLLKNIQRAITSGVKQIVMIDLANAGITFKPDEIEVDFKTKLVEINNLDELEFADTTVQMISNIRDFVFELADKESSPVADNIDMKMFVEYLDKQFSSIGLKGLVKTDVKPKDDVPGAFDADDPQGPPPEPAEEPPPEGEGDE